MKKLFIVLSILSSTAPISFSQLAKGDRILAFQVEEAENQSYDDAFQLCTDNCMEVVHLQYPWGQYETNADEFDPDKMVLMDITNFYYPANNMKLELNIGAMNTTVNDIPADLQDVSYASTEMADRFKAFLDTVFNRIPDVKLQALNISNESDIYMDGDAQLYADFKVFLDAVAPYAKQKYMEIHGEELNVGTTLTLGALVHPDTSVLCENLNSEMDIISTTYYPLVEGFQMAPPTVVASDFQSVIDIYDDVTQPIYMVECGYASSPFCGSSPSLQAQFFQEVFAAWDTYYDNLKLISIFKLTDWSQDQVDEFGDYYGIDDQAFLEYLRTLGLRTWDGTGNDKLAFNTLACELVARNWCDEALCVLSVDEKLSSSLSIYPNPANDQLQMEIDATIDLVQIHDISGRLILERTSSERTINLSGIESGRYIVSVFSSKETTRKELIKL